MTRATEIALRAVRSPWTWRVLFAATLAAQAAVCLHVFPPEDRFYLHPDDHDTMVYGQQVLRTGRPAIPVEEGLPESAMLAPVGSTLGKPGEFITTRAPGYFYLMAPFSASLKVATWASLMFAELAALSVFLLAERFSRPWIAFLACQPFVWSPAVLFWSNLMVPNMAATGMLAAACLMLAKDGRPWPELGAFLLGLSCMFRFEYLIVAAVVGVLLIFTHGRSGRPVPWTAVLGLLAGICVVLLASWAFYGTPNFVSVSRKVGSPVEETLTGTLANTGGQNVREAWAEFGFLLFPLGIGFAGFALWPPARPVLGVVAGVAAMAVYLLATGFAEQIFFLSSSQVRYIIPVLALGAVGLAHLGSRLTVRAAALVLAVACLLPITSAEMAFGKDGFQEAERLMESHRQDAQAMERLPGPACVVNDFGYSRKVQLVTPKNVPEESRLAELTALLDSLLDRCPVFISVTPRHGDYRQALQDAGFRLQASGVPGYLSVTRGG